MFMKSELRDYLKARLLGGLAFGVGTIIVVAFTGLVAQALNSFSPGDLVSSTMINDNFQNLSGKIQSNTTQLTIVAPDGLIAAFNLSACPAGWIPADGTNGTPDLRGVFIRGLDNLGTGAAGRDPWGVRGLAAYQPDEFAQHNHSSPWSGPRGGNGSSPNFATNDPAYGTKTTGNTGGSETRPKNVALFYCMRQS